MRRSIWRWPRVVTPTAGKPIVIDLPVEKFAFKAPNPQSTADVFAGRWASELAGVLPNVRTGGVDHFTSDPRPRFLLKNFANADGNLRGKSILELGPLEGAHTYQLEKLGATALTAIDANVEAYLKCLIVKELCGLKIAQFLYGDFVEYLRQEEKRWDIIFCCGVLYHMTHPLDLIELLIRRTDRVFVWTHYYSPDFHKALTPISTQFQGKQFTYYRRRNVDRDYRRYWGSGFESSCVLKREDILAVFALGGLKNYEIHQEDVEHPNGPSFSISFWR
jgi:hypothetical protein